MCLGEILDRPSVRLFRETAEVAQAVAFVVTVALSLAGAAYFVASRLGASAAIVLVVVSSAGLLFITICGFMFYIIVVHQPDDYSFQHLSGSLDVLPAGDHHDYVYERSQKVLIRRDDVRLIRIRSHWSGKSVGSGIVSSLMSDHLLLDGQDAEADGRTYRWVYLREPLGRAADVEVGIRHEFSDDLEKMKTYFRESGEGYATKAIEVCVRFKSHDVPDSVTGKVWRSRRRGEPRQVVGLMPCVQSRDTASDMVVFKLDVRRPNRNSAYGISWKWKEAPPARRRMIQAP